VWAVPTTVRFGYKLSPLAAGDPVSKWMSTGSWYLAALWAIARGAKTLSSTKMPMSKIVWAIPTAGHPK
jgi:hypothetical protein